MEYNINLTAYLAEFADKVNKKEYAKLIYEVWRQLDHYAKKDNIDVKLDYEAERNKVKLIIHDRPAFHTQIKRFDPNDNSFGTFLWKKHLDLEFNGQPVSVFADKNDIVGFEPAPTDTLKADKGIGCLGFWEPKEKCIDFVGDVRVNGTSIENNIKSTIDETLYSIKQKGENEMSNLFKGFEFGTCANDKIKMSLYGLAVQNATGTWVSYDPASATIIDVDPFNYEGGKYLYKMPVAIKDVKEGDLIIHNRKPMFVVDVKDGIKAVDIAAGEEKNIVPTRNMFGFDFITRVTSLFDIGGFNKPNAEQPFGNMLPLMLLSNEGNTDDMLPLMMMMNGGTDFTANPMMLYFLMKDNKNSDMLPLMFLMNNNK